MAESFWKKNKLYLEVIGLLLLIWAGLLWYASADAPLEMELEIKQSDLHELFPEDTTSFGNGGGMAGKMGDFGDVDSLMVPNVFMDSTTMTHPSDTGSHYILLCGDSMSEGLMFAFKKYAKFNGHFLKTRIWYSSTTPQWSKTDTLAAFIRQYRPSFVIFTLGSNELFIRKIEEREQYIENIVQQADQYGVPFVWVGPPNWKDDTGINDLIEKHIGHDRFFVSKDLEFKRKSDGAHPTNASSAVWADTISSWITQTSRYKGKILLKDPKLYPDEPDRPYIPPTEAIAGRDDGGAWKVSTKPKPEATTSTTSSNTANNDTDTTSRSTPDTNSSVSASDTGGNSPATTASSPSDTASEGDNTTKPPENRATSPPDTIENDN